MGPPPGPGLGWGRLGPDPMDGYRGAGASLPHALCQRPQWIRSRPRTRTRQSILRAPLPRLGQACSLCHVLPCPPPSPTARGSPPACWPEAGRCSLFLSSDTCAPLLRRPRTTGVRPRGPLARRGTRKAGAPSTSTLSAGRLSAPFFSGIFPLRKLLLPPPGKRACLSLWKADLGGGRRRPGCVGIGDQASPFPVTCPGPCC